MSLDIRIDQYEAMQEALEQLHSDVAKDLEQIRKDKIEIQSLKDSIIDELQNCYYIRDKGRVVISAPEIVIGNVGQDGTLLSGGSRITLRAESINLEGVGVDDTTCGEVVTRASLIRNIAEDPGIDGCESVVKSASSIVNVARKVVLQSEDADSLFLYPSESMGSGVDIISDSIINVESVLQCDTVSDVLKDRKSDLSDLKSDLTSTCSSLKSDIKSALSTLSGIKSDDIDDITGDATSVILENEDLIASQEDFEATAKEVYRMMSDYFAASSRLAELNRQVSALEDASSANSSLKSKYKTKDVGNQVNIVSEYISLDSRDGDGNIRETPSSAVTINAKSVSVTTQDKDQKQIVDSSIKMLSELIEVSTANPKVTDSSAEYPAEGGINIVSRNISLEAVDYKLSDDKIEESLLTKNGAITMRASTILSDTTSTDGTNDGLLIMNSKRIEAKSMDVDKDSRKDKSMTKGGEMLLNAEKMYVGGSGASAESDNSTLLQLVSSDLGLFGSTTVELQQDKAIVQLTGGNFSASGGTTEIYGKTTMADEVTLKGALSGVTAEFKKVDVSTIFTGPSISDGMGVATASGGGSLSAKMKQAEISATPTITTEEV